MARWAEAKNVTIYLSEIVAREFQTAPLTAVNGFAAARKALAEVKRLLPDESQARLDLLEAEIAAEFATIEKVAAVAFAKWLSRTNTRVINVDDAHCRRVLNGYFAGDPPFRAPKAREDFPDAFVLEGIRDLAADAMLFVVASDRRLAQAASGLTNVRVFPDVTSLIKSLPFTRLRNELLHTYEKENIAAALDTFAIYRHKFDGRLTQALGSAVDGLEVPYRHTNEPNDGESQPPAVVCEPGAVHQWSTEVAAANYLGEGVISMPFVASIDVALDPSGDDTDDDHDETVSTALSVEGTLSLILDRHELRRKPFYGIALAILDRAILEIDTIDELRIEDAEEY